MNMKKTVSLALAAMFAFSVMGCGSDKKEPS